MSNWRSKALLEKCIFSQCSKILLTASSIKQENGNHYAKTYPGWEEAGIKNTLSLCTRVFCFRNTVECFWTPGALSPWSSCRKLQPCPNLENSVSLPEAHGNCICWGLDYWFVSLEFCCILLVTQTIHTDETCSNKRNVLWKILIFHCAGKPLNFFCCCCCLIVFVQVTFQWSSVVCFAEAFFSNVFISVSLSGRTEYLDKKVASNWTTTT